MTVSRFPQLPRHHSHFHNECQLVFTGNHTVCLDILERQVLAVHQGSSAYSDEYEATYSVTALILKQNLF